MTEILFVHGALVRDGAWWWHRVADLLMQRSDVPSQALALPSCGEGEAGLGEAGLAEDAAALRATLDRKESVIVVGHSYGGTVIAEGANHPAAAHLLYITSYLPLAGETQAGILAEESDPVPIAELDDGTVAVTGYDDDGLAARFWGDLSDPDMRSQAASRVVPQSLAALITPTTAAAWRNRASTYLVCTNDRSTSVDLQRLHAARAGRSVDLPTSHHPFLSRPDLVVDELQRILDTLPRS